MGRSSTKKVSGTRVERALIDGGFEQSFLRAWHAQAPERQSLVREANKQWGVLRSRLGYTGVARVLTDAESQYKLRKNSTATYGLMLIPAAGIMDGALGNLRDVFSLEGVWNLCPRASVGCQSACLSRSGQSGMPVAQKAQAARTAFLLAHPGIFATLLADEVRKGVAKYGKIQLRLNTTSDIRWEQVAPLALAAMLSSGVELYDYTAWSPAERRHMDGYQLTYSAKEPSHTPDEYLEAILEQGGNIAMPFAVAKGQPLPKHWRGWPIIDGDLNDERYSDPHGVVVGLRAKGHEWKRRQDGFIREVATMLEVRETGELRGAGELVGSSQ